MSYLDKKGNYYGGDKQPGSVDAQERPDIDSVLIADPLSDPLNCWRVKTAQEIGAEKNAEANKFATTKRAAQAQAWVNYKFIKDPSLYATPKAYWDAIVVAFRDRPWKP